MDGLTDGLMDRRTEGPMDQRTNGPVDRWTNGPTDQRTNKVGCKESPPANLGMFVNGEWTHVDEQCHTAVHERVKTDSWQTILFMEGPKKHVHERPFIESLLNS